MERTAELWEAKMQEAWHAQLDRIEEHEQHVFDRLAETLCHQTGIAVQAMEEHATRACAVFTGELQTVSQALHALCEASNNQVIGLQEHNQQVVNVLVERANQHTVAIVQALEVQADHVREALTNELRTLAQQLQRTPEVSIRYPSTDGVNGRVPVLSVEE
jgi:hypothetical protein